MACFRRKPSAPRLVIAAGLILIVVNILYIVSSVVTDEVETFSAIGFFYLARAGMGTYLFIAGTKILRNNPPLAEPA